MSSCANFLKTCSRSFQLCCCGHLCNDGCILVALCLLSKAFSIAAASVESKEMNNSEGINTLETIPEAVPVALTEPPIEEQLAWHTLWPESHKLYGHGNELFAVCSDHQGKIVASSCKVFLIFHESMSTFCKLRSKLVKLNMI